MSIRFHWVLVAATVMSVLVILEDYTSYLINGFEFDYSWFSVPAKALSNYWAWCLFAPVFDFLAKKLTAPESKSIASVLRMLSIGTLTALVHRGLAIFSFDLAYSLDSGYLSPLLSEKNKILLSTGWVTSLIQFAIILLVFFAIVYYRQYLQKQKELNEAQLQALKMQLHPHFLFNTLHSISSLIDIDPKSAQKMVAQLGTLMRSTLEQKDRSSVLVEEEVAYVKDYLAIEQVRFQDRLTIEYEIDPKAAKIEVPYLILQPLVENAIKHGIQDLQEDGLVKVCVKIHKDRLEMSVQDNGLGASGNKPGMGLGLTNVSRRLEQFYDNDFELEYGPVQPKGFRVFMSVPFLKQNV